MGLSPEQNKRKQELLDKFLNYDFLTYDEITELAYLLKNDNTIDRKICHYYWWDLNKLHYIWVIP